MLLAGNKISTVSGEVGYAENRQNDEIGSAIAAKYTSLILLLDKFR